MNLGFITHSRKSFLEIFFSSDFGSGVGSGSFLVHSRQSKKDWTVDYGLKD